MCEEDLFSAAISSGWGGSHVTRPHLRSRRRTGPAAPALSVGGVTHSRNSHSRPRQDHIGVDVRGFPAGGRGPARRAGARTIAQLLSPASRDGATPPPPSGEARRAWETQTWPTFSRVQSAPVSLPCTRWKQATAERHSAPSRREAAAAPSHPPAPAIPLLSPHGRAALPAGPLPSALPRPGGGKGGASAGAGGEGAALEGGRAGGCRRSGRWLLQPQLRQPLPAGLPSEMSLVPGTTSAVPEGLPVTNAGPAAAPLPLPPGRALARGGSQGLVIFAVRKAVACGFPWKLVFLGTGLKWMEAEGLPVISVPSNIDG